MREVLKGELVAQVRFDGAKFGQKNCKTASTAAHYDNKRRTVSALFNKLKKALAEKIKTTAKAKNFDIED